MAFKPSHHLLSKKRFAPFFWIQFLGAFNDNTYKNALLLFFTYQLAALLPFSPELMVTIASGLFILPFFLFSTIAGQLADKLEKTQLIRVLKVTELVVMILGFVGFYIKSAMLLMVVLVLMGVQSAFFGPIKYSILPLVLKPTELLGGNALVSGGTFLAILLGTIVGGLGIALDHGIWVIGLITVGVSLLGIGLSAIMPLTNHSMSSIKVSLNVPKDIYHLLKQGARSRGIILSILGLCWFWIAGATFLAQLPIYAANIMNANEEVVTIFLTLFSVGIAVGSIACNRLFEGRLSGRPIWCSMVAIAIFMIDFSWVSYSLTPNPSVFGFNQFWNYEGAFRLSMDLFVVAISGGFLTVPLLTWLQTSATDENRSRMVALNNISNSFAMVMASLWVVLMYSMGFSVIDVFAVLGCLGIVIAGVYYWVLRTISF